LKKPNYYTIVKAALENGNLESIRDIQKIVPITVLTQDMQLNYNTLSKRLLDPSRFTLLDINRLAGLIGVDSSELFKKIVKEIRGKK
jgi:hypothetical protein